MKIALRLFTIAAIILRPWAALPETLTSIYSFYSSGLNGAYPTAGLLNVGGILYGTTETGGVYGSIQNFPSGGVLFKFNPKTRSATVIHNFGNGSDGVDPVSPLSIITAIFMERQFGVESMVLEL